MNFDDSILTGCTPLVTGASSGIGKAIAVELARRGCESMGIVGRDEVRLRQTGDTLEELGCRAIPFQADLAVDGAVERLYEGVLESELDSIDILVNSAGEACGGEIVETSFEDVRTLNRVHVLALQEMCIRFGKDMKDQGGGIIMNVSSVAAYSAVPYTAIYAAAKANMLSFTHALRKELREYGVWAIHLAPGATDTAFMDRAGLKKTRVFGKTARQLGLVMTPEKVAEIAVDGMLRNHKDIIPGLPNKGLFALTKILPGFCKEEIGALLLRNHEE